MSLLAINYFVQLNQISLLNLLFFGNTLILGSTIFTVYNRIVTLKNRALNALSNIDIELKRRADLIPSIVEIVKGYAKHESEIQKIVAEGRAQRIFSSELKRPEKPTIPSLVAAIENYPELKASENFQSLMKTLVDTEERIAYSREFYNRTVRKYNTLIKQIPFSLVAKILKLKEMEFVSIVRG
jgi:LemA protein